jgi:hypothetical protein
MSAYSVSADRIGAWIADELDAQSAFSGDEFGYGITMIPVPQPRGTAITWFVLVTLRHPLLGHDALGASSQIQANEPGEAQVREVARESAASLRTAYANAKKDIISKGNGHSELPAALKGLQL